MDENQRPGIVSNIERDDPTDSFEEVGAIVAAQELSSTPM